jgi:hypothetical protein
MIQIIPDKVCKKCGGTEWKDRKGKVDKQGNQPLTKVCYPCLRSYYKPNGKERGRRPTILFCTKHKIERIFRLNLKTCCKLCEQEKNKEFYKGHRSSILKRSSTEVSLITVNYVKGLISKSNPLKPSQIQLSTEDYQLYKESLILKRQYNGTTPI